jgi:hypothetical protein
MNPSNGTPVLKWNADQMRGPAWLRAILAAVACTGAITAFILGAVLKLHGSRNLDALGGFVMTYFYGVPLLIFGLSSIIIAVGLFRKSIFSIKVALAFDAIVVLAVMSVTAMLPSEIYDPMNPVGKRIFFSLLPSAIALPSCVEAAWLLSACRGWRRAWWAMGIVLLVLVMGPLVGCWWHVR